MRLKRYIQFVKESLAQVQPQTQAQTQTEEEDFTLSYLRVYYDDLLMQDVVAEEVMESKDEVIEKLMRGSLETTPEEFLASVKASSRVEFMTPYTEEELSTINLFKVEGFNIGFAVKEDGDIILVHNNEKVGGIGRLLIEKAVEKGGTKLDHFDGFLTGFYRELGFRLESNYPFVDEWTPEGWKFEPVNIDDPMTSIYAEELEVENDEKIDAAVRYKSGKPDVVYRILYK
jgi:hypothetical protein